MARHPRRSRKELTAAFERRHPLLEQLAANLHTVTLGQLDGTPHIDRISFRTKSVDSFVGKVIERHLDPPYQEPLVEVEDQVAGRVIVFFTDDIDIVRESVDHLFSAVEASRHEPDRENEFDYESFHAVYAIPPNVLPQGWDEIDAMPETFELQIRTLFQHAYAEPQHDVAYKATVPLPREDRRELAWIAANAWGADQALLRVRRRVDARTAGKTDPSCPPS
jgi:putative GTP pyrophosphokinase